MIDSHCHLAGEEFVEDLDAVVARATAVGLQGALCILDAGNRVERDRVAGLRARWPALRFAAGVHPHQAATVGDPDAVEALVRGALADAAACAIGEVGLDYHYEFAPRDVQRAVFGRQVHLARLLALPLVIHTREADADTVAVLQAEGGGEVRGVLHCFTGDAALAGEALALGFHVSFSGIVTFPRAGSLREVAASVPRERVLIETDSPYLAPVPHRGRRNEPAWVVHVAQTLAEVWGTPVDEVLRQTTANFAELFGSLAPHRT
jgi:TatD DNase family protein